MRPAFGRRGSPLIDPATRRIVAPRIKWRRVAAALMVAAAWGLPIGVIYLIWRFL